MGLQLAGAPRHLASLSLSPDSSAPEGRPLMCSPAGRPFGPPNGYFRARIWRPPPRCRLKNAPSLFVFADLIEILLRLSRPPTTNETSAADPNYWAPNWFLCYLSISLPISLSLSGSRVACVCMCVCVCVCVCVYMCARAKSVRSWWAQE